jgi:lipoprotein-releasing system ATP-binding protein
MIYTKNVHKSYRNTLGKVVREVLQSLDLEVASGERVAIMGPSGSGKTTLLNLLSTLDTPDAGEIFVGGQRLSDLSQEEVLQFRNRQVGFVFQFHRLLPQCTLWENVLLPTLASGKADAAVEAWGAELVQRMGIEAVKDHFPDELSGGECQRAAVARALIHKPQLLLADEPTGSLDGANARALMDLLLEAQDATGVTLVVATHSHEIAALMDCTYTLKEGRLER